MRSIAIVGGGISGLSLAYFLERRDPTLDITLFEKEEVGGKVQTHRERELVIERGADSVLLKRGSHLERLLYELQLEKELIEPQEKSFSIQRDGLLHEIPLGLLRGFPHNLKALWGCSLFSLRGRFAATLRPLLTRIIAEPSEQDPSIAQALRWRYGTEVSKYFFETVFGGIHSGDATQLSFNALYPDMARGGGGKYTRARFVSFPRGMGVLPETIAKNLKQTKIRREAAEQVAAIAEQVWQVTTAKESLTFDSVIIATPAYETSHLVSSFSQELSSELNSIQHSSTAVVTFVVPLASIRTKPTGSGYLLAVGEAGSVTGCTYSSRKWQGRAPDDKLVVRIFFGRNGGVRGVSDAELKTVAAREVAAKLQVPHETLELAGVGRWEKGLPQYELGHRSKVERIQRIVGGLPGFFLTGTSYEGVGIPDCVRQSFEVCEKVIHYLQRARTQEPKELSREENEYGSSICA